MPARARAPRASKYEGVLFTGFCRVSRAIGVGQFEAEWAVRFEIGSSCGCLVCVPAPPGVFEPRLPPFFRKYRGDVKHYTRDT